MKKTFVNIFILAALCLPLSSQAQTFEENLSFDLGVLEYRQGNYEKAVDIMQEIVDNSPEDYRAKYYLAITYVKLKKFKKARDLYVEIIARSNDESLLEYSRKGLKYLDPEFYKEFRKNNFQIVDTQQKQPEKQKPDIIETSQKQPDVNLNASQQTMVKQLSQEHQVSQEEINNLLKVLAQNPSALQTINKLANSKSAQSGGTYDPESVAKLVRMLTLNSQMGLLDFNNKSNDNNNNDNDMMSLMMGINGFSGNNSMGNNNFAQMMNYLSDPSKKDKVNPQMIDALIKNSMMGGMGGMGNMGGF